MLKCIRGNLDLKYIEFKNGVENGQVFPIYLLEGEDAFIRERALNMLKNKYLSEPELNLVNFDGEKLQANELISSLGAYPFMSEKRFSVVREYYPKAQEVAKNLKPYFDNPSNQSILVIINEKPCDALKKAQGVTIVDCAKMDKFAIAKYVKHKCALSGVEIDMQTASTLAEYCKCDMTRVEGECEKLICYSLQKKTITLDDIELLTVKDVEFKIYEMTGFLAKKNFDMALTVIQDMLDKGETLQRILISVYNAFRKLLHVAISDKTNEELSKIFGSSETAVKILRTQAESFKKKSLKQAVDMLSDTDYLIKSGVAEAEDKIWHNIFAVMTA